jgi:hypothetical protein
MQLSFSGCIETGYFCNRRLAAFACLRANPVGQIPTARLGKALLHGVLRAIALRTVL